MLLDRLISWSRNEVAPPYKIHLQITRACNLRCKSCWQPGDTFRSREDLTRERLLEIIPQAAALGVKEWNIIGGEPLARRTTCRQVMETIREQGMNGELSTNGTLFNEELIVSLVEREWAHVRFSIDCADAETHDSLRGKTGAFLSAEWALKTIRDKKQQLHRQLPRTEIMMVLSSQNYQTLPQMIEFAASLGVNKLTVQPASILSSEGESLRLDTDHYPDILEWIHKAKRTADATGIEHQIGDLYEERLLKNTDQMDSILRTDVTELPKDFFSMFCFDPWFLMAIRPNADCGPCDRFVDKFRDDGPRECDSIMEKDLAEIWTGPYFTKIRSLVASGTIPFYCRDCCVCKITHCRSLRAMAYRRMGRYQEAITVYKKALQDNPHQENYWLGIGSCLQDMKQFSDAITYYKRVVEINPNQVWGWYGLGECASQTNQYEEAEQYFRNGLRQPYLESHVHYLLLRGAGLCLLRKSMFPQALEFFQKAETLEPNHEDIRRLIEQCRKSSTE